MRANDGGKVVCIETVKEETVEDDSNDENEWF
jgi:hypothetical protein